MLMFCHIPNLVMNYGVYVLILYYVYLTRYFYHLILLLLISSSHDTVSWLDHVLSTTSGHSLFTNISVKFDFITSDYLPLCFSISIDNMHVPIPPADSTSRDLFKAPPPLGSRKLLCQSSPYHTCEFYQVFLA